MHDVCTALRITQQETAQYYIYCPVHSPLHHHVCKPLQLLLVPKRRRAQAPVSRVVVALGAQQALLMCHILVDVLRSRERVCVSKYVCVFRG